jgi:hypothetical protein
MVFTDRLSDETSWLVEKGCPSGSGWYQPGGVV